ncbi:phosphoglycerate mutase-like protein [Rhizopogon salebrosus TDB-379]|nr:phosphoglycerate mutase-like protein [Rhizopogon salebrosus TDB-379]
MKQKEAPLDVEGYPLAPEGLNLEQVHVYVRHGERTPIVERMSDPPASIPAEWQMCNISKNFLATVAGYSSTVDDGLRYKKVAENRHGKTSEGLCLLAELTDIGKQSTYSFGAALRSLYIDSSTNISRTIESLRHIVHGLYPPSACAPGTIPPIFIRNGADENLISNTLACKRLALLKLQFEEAATVAWNSRLEPLDKKVSKYIGGRPLRLDGTPRASGVLDTVFKSEEGRRLGMGRLLADVSGKMQRKAQLDSKDPTKLLVHATHDSTLAALLCTFDVFDEKWPPFTSSVTFELFRKQSLPEQQTNLQQMLSSFWGRSFSDEYYVRMRYKDRNMVLPMCAAPGKHLPGSPEFCTLSAFQERVKELTPKDWNAECFART